MRMIDKHMRPVLASHAVSIRQQGDEHRGIIGWARLGRCLMLVPREVSACFIWSVIYGEASESVLFRNVWPVQIGVGIRDTWRGTPSAHKYLCVMLHGSFPGVSC